MNTQKPAVLLLSASAQVKKSITTIIQSDYSIIEAKTVNQGLSFIDVLNPSICVIGFNMANRDDAQAINDLKEHKDDLIIILVCPREQKEALLASKLPNEVFRVIFAPLSPGQTKLTLSAAVKLLQSQGKPPTLMDNSGSDEPTQSAQAQQTVEAIPQAIKSQTTAPSQKPISQTKAAPTTAAQEEITLETPKVHKLENFSETLRKAEEAANKPSKSKLMPIIASVAVIGLIGTAWFFMQSMKTKSAQEAANQERVTLETANAEIQTKVDTLLQNAQSALMIDNRFPPTENNALDNYYRILDLDAQNQTAQAAITELSKLALGDLDLQIANGSVREAQQSISTARARAEGRESFSSMINSLLNEKKIALVDSANSALSSGDLSNAASLIGIARDVFGSDDAALNRAHELITTQQANNDKAAEINGLVNNIQATLQAKQLLQPNQNNAQYFINRLESIDSENTNLVQLKQEFASSLLTEAKTATDNADFTAAKRFIDSATAAGANGNLLNVEGKRLADAQAEFQAKAAADLAEAEATRIANEQLQEQQRQADLARQAEEDRLARIRLLATPVNVALSELNATKRTAPSYPKRYEQRGISGSADVAFTVNIDGSISNVIVVAVEPSSATSFGKAAVKAVEEWSFEPYTDAAGNVRIATSEIKIKFNF